jgi:hypothetical protein
VGWNGHWKAGRLLFSVVQINVFFGRGGGGREEIAICDWAIKFNHFIQLPTSLMPQSNGNDLGYGDNNEVAGDKEDNGGGCKSNGDGNGDKDGGQATGTLGMAAVTTRAMVMAVRWWETKRAMARVARAMMPAMRMADNKEGSGKSGRSNCDGNDGGGRKR